jgi:hypothetical protein
MYKRYVPSRRDIGHYWIARKVSVFNHDQNDARQAALFHLHLQFDFVAWDFSVENNATTAITSLTFDSMILGAHYIVFF